MGSIPNQTIEQVMRIKMHWSGSESLCLLLFIKYDHIFIRSKCKES